MFNLKIKLATAAIAVASAASFASPAIAGQCTTPGVNALANAPTMPQGRHRHRDRHRSILGTEIGVDGRQLRTRRLVVQPGGIVPLHSHKDRPALIYTLSGSITEYQLDLQHADRAHRRRHQPRSRRPQPLLDQPRQRAGRPALVGRLSRPVIPPPALHSPPPATPASRLAPRRDAAPHATESQCPISPIPRPLATRPGLTLRQSLLIAVIGFLTLVDLFATQAILPSLAKVYGVTPSQIGLAANASTLGMAISGLLVGVFSRAIERKRAIALCLLLLSVPTALLAFAPKPCDLRVPAGGPGPVHGRRLHADPDSSRRALRSAHRQRPCRLRNRRRREQSHRPPDRRLRRQPGRRRTELPILRAAQPRGRRAGQPRAAPQRARADGSHGPLLGAWLEHLADPALRRTFAIGFLILFGFIGVFTYVGFVLMRPPHALSMTALGLVFLVFLPSMITTPMAGSRRALDRSGPASPASLGARACRPRPAACCRA